jgi:hypothetical protein
MNIKQALKEKNKLVAEIKELYDTAKKTNSIEVGNPRRFSVEDSLKDAESKTKQLVELKTKIHKANLSVYEKIFRMSEMKNRNKELKAISTEEGKVSQRYGSTVENKEVELNAAQIKAMVKGLESEIEKIQDELDVHNATTQLD